MLVRHSLTFLHKTRKHKQYSTAVPVGRTCMTRQRAQKGLAIKASRVRMEKERGCG